jgi:hypothetical protein
MRSVISEKQLQALILSKLGSREDIRLFRNTVGFGYTGQLVEWRQGCIILANARKTTFGLCPGSADLIGVQKLVITPDMAGQTIGRFVSIEVKSERGTLSDEQKNWLRMVQSMGGYGVAARDLGEIIL